MADVVFGDFEWDAAKAAKVLRRRRIDCRVVCKAFEDDRIMTIPNADESDEERWLSIGMVGDKLFTIVHCSRGARERIITTWLSTGQEHDSYYRQKG